MAIGCEGHRRLLDDLAPAIPGCEGRQAIASIQAIYTAAETGRAVVTDLFVILPPPGILT